MCIGCVCYCCCCCYYMDMFVCGNWFISDAIIYVTYLLWGPSKHTLTIETEKTEPIHNAKLISCQRCVFLIAFFPSLFSFVCVSMCVCMSECWSLSCWFGFFLGASCKFVVFLTIWMVAFHLHVQYNRLHFAFWRWMSPIRTQNSSCEWKSLPLWVKVVDGIVFSS